MNRRWTVYVAAAVCTIIFIVLVRNVGGSSEPPYRPLPPTSDSKSLGTKPLSAFPTGYPAKSNYRSGPIKRPGEPYSLKYVLAKTRKEDVSWLYNHFPDANVTIYEVDAQPDKLKIPKNKGREAMVYLTYLIDEYDSLPDVSIFFHPHQYAWHNSDLHGQNILDMLENLNPAHVTRVGYMPLRCQHNPGCPDWNHLDQPQSELDSFLRQEEKYFISSTWKELNPELPVPVTLSEPCCSQFALSRDRVRSVPLSKYRQYRDWLLNTKLDDQISGRWMEYTWQVLFTGEAEWCPSQNVCLCDGYGMCFGGDYQFQHWLDMNDKIQCWEKEAEILEKDHSWPDKAFSLRREARLKKQWREDVKRQAIERGKDPRSRAMDCSRAWKEGDGF